MTTNNFAEQIEETPEEFISRLILERLGFAGCFVLVEGETDRKFFYSRLDEDNCILFSISGRTGVRQRLALANLPHNRRQLGACIAIVDADYDRLENNLPADNEFFTDVHDLETMLLASSVLEKIIPHSTQKEKLKTLKEEVITKIFDVGYKMGLLHWFSTRHDIGLAVKHDKLICEKFIRLNVAQPHIEFLPTEYITSVLNNTKLEAATLKFSQILEAHYNSQGVLEWFDEEHSKYLAHKLQICNGHHLVAVLHFILHNVEFADIHTQMQNINVDELFAGDEEAERKKAKYLKKIKKQNIETFQDKIFIAYEEAEFKQTELYKNLKIWGEENNIDLFKRKAPI